MRKKHVIFHLLRFYFSITLLLAFLFSLSL